MRRLLACAVCLVLLAGPVVADAGRVTGVHRDRVLFDGGLVRGRWIGGDMPLPGDEYEGHLGLGYQVVPRKNGGETTFVIDGPESIGQGPLEYLFGD